MKKHKPTPGPWFMQVNGRHRPEVCDAHGECIVEVYAINDLNDASNARLIAAAPDMLAELKADEDMILAAIPHAPRIRDLLMARLSAVRAAIAKAEGQ